MGGTSCEAKCDRAPLASSVGSGGKPAQPDSRSGCGPSPLGVHEQAPPAAPVTSEVSTEEGTATKHHPLLLSLPWEHTGLTVPLSNTLGNTYTCLRVTARALQLGAACATFPWVLAIVKGPATRHWLPALPIASISLEACTAPYQGDNSLHTLSKETASI